MLDSDFHLKTMILLTSGKKYWISVHILDFIYFQNNKAFQILVSLLFDGIVQVCVLTISVAIHFLLPTPPNTIMQANFIGPYNYSFNLFAQDIELFRTGQKCFCIEAGNDI